MPEKNTPQYGSDLMVELLRTLNIPYVALNPGASFRGLHDSLVQYGNVHVPQIIECTHEEISVAVAHGYAKASGQLMAAAIHNVVGLQHASMAIYNAWCDRAPVLLLGGTGPMDVAKRRPWIDWIHTALVQGNLVRDYVKWDDQPATLASLPDSFYRAWRLALTEPAGPVYICLDGALQEDPIPAHGDLEIPNPAHFAPARSPAPDPKGLDIIADAIRQASWPVVVADHSGRSEEGFYALSTLAQRWAIPVIDRGGRLNLPTDHPMNLTGAEEEILAHADVVVAFDVRDLFGTLSGIDRVARTTVPMIKDTARIFAIGLQDYGTRSWTADFQRLMPMEFSMLADTRLALPALLEALGTPPPEITARYERVRQQHQDLREEWKRASLEAQNQVPVATSTLARILFESLGQGPFVLANGDLHGWTHRIGCLDRPRQYLGESGGGGLGYGIGAAIGAALSYRDSDTLVVDIQSDGDLMFTPGGLWTLAHEKLPVLVVMYNNRSYYNSEEHQFNMARHRRRDEQRSEAGTRIEDPNINFAALAASMGVEGIGPIERAQDLSTALARGIDIVRRERRSVLIDVITQAR